MKTHNIAWVFTAAAALMSLAGCREFNDTVYDPATAGEALRFSAASIATRTAVDTAADKSLFITWAEGDEIGIYATTDGRSAGSNYSYTAFPDEEDATRCIFTATDASELLRWQNRHEQGFFAYYPYTPVGGRELDASNHPVTIPAVQTQSGGNSAQHLSAYGFMVANPVAVASGVNIAGGIEFHFSNIFSVVELRLKMDETCPIASVPVKVAKLISSAGALSYPEANIDLKIPVTAEQLPVTPVISENSVTLTVDGNASLGKNDWTSLYMVVAPGEHPADDLQLEITAIDNSVYTIPIAEGVTFKSNRHYVREYVLSLDGFIAAESFEAEIPSLTVALGEPVKVVMSGAADRVEFWSGEKYHDYAYHDTDRFQKPSMFMNFKMWLANGYQRKPVAVKYSTDYVDKRPYTEDDILAATWTDVSDKFNMEMPLLNVDKDPATGNLYPLPSKTVQPYDCGTVDCSDWFSDETDKCRIAFFYTVNAHDASWDDPKNGGGDKPTANGRTYFYLYDTKIYSQHLGEAMVTEFDQHAHILENNTNVLFRTNYAENTAADPSCILAVLCPAYNFADDGTNPMNNYDYDNTSGKETYRFGSAFTPKVARHTYVLVPEITRPEAKNLGRDTAISIKGADDENLSEWEYTFVAPGTYDVVVVGAIPGLSGDREQVYRFTVTVTE